MKPEPFFKIGDRVTFKYKKDCKAPIGKKKYFLGGDDRGGETTTIECILDFNNFYQCYLVMESKQRYRMLESEFIEYKSLKDNYTIF